MDISKRQPLAWDEVFDRLIFTPEEIQKSDSRAIEISKALKESGG